MMFSSINEVLHAYYILILSKRLNVCVFVHFFLFPFHFILFTLNGGGASFR